MRGTVSFKTCGSVLVTGANRGLELQIVQNLASGGFSPGKIIATTRNLSGSQVETYLMSELHLLVVILYVVRQDSIETCVEEVERLLDEDQGLNLLINIAGVNLEADFQVVTAEMTMENFRTNAVAPLMITKVICGRVGSGGKGAMGIQRAAVVNVSSLLGSVELNWGDRANVFKWYPYRTSKVSVLRLTSRCMAVDLEPDGILCVAVHPGWVHTDMGGSRGERRGAPLSPEESVSSVLSVIGALTAKDHGTFLNYTGEQLPW
uniref:Si:dkey-12e7.4 n=1 Tax=Kryptolebias marmoratus TaxID=37003 RepID=A0A3Q3F7U1_KRYMA